MDRTRVSPTDFEIRELAETDDVSAFSCGKDADLDDFIRDDAKRLQAQGVARTFVAVYQGRIVAYAALLADAVILKPAEREKIGLERMDPGNIPALKVGRLATDATFGAQYVGAGTALMRFALYQALEMSALAACRLLTVDAYGEAVAFYEGKLGFVRNKDPRNHKRGPVLCAKCSDALDADAPSATGKSTVSMRFDIAALEFPDWAR